jgi:hypothetical protein
MGMGVSFFIPCPLTGGLSVPRKSGHTRNADLTIIQHGGGCPDLSGPAGALRIGHGIKKDTPMPMPLTKGHYFASSKGRD